MYLLTLEVEVTVVYHLCLKHQVLHKVAHALQILLAVALHLSIHIKLGSGAHRLLQHLYHVDTGITLDGFLAELSGLSSCYST